MLGYSYTIREIAEAAYAKDLFQGFADPDHLRYVAFDSRLIGHGAETIFVAIQTAHRDGHEFIPEAIEKGVRNFIVEKPVPFPNINYVLADDAKDCLQMWARFHRRRFTYPVIGITGSNGKTIVKEWLATLLDMKYQIVKSPMSYNSQIGVAVSVLQMRPDADLAIFEAGISQAGEMDFLWELIRPDTGILTHFGHAHAEGFQSPDQKLEEKCRLFSGVSRLIAGGDQQEVVSYLKSRNFPLQTIGQSAGSDFRVHLTASSGSVTGLRIDFQEGTESFTLPFAGEAAVDNACLAIMTAHQMGLSPAEIRERLPLLRPVSMRTEMITDNPEITLINDAYNSDVDSIRNAFHLLLANESQPGRKVILTDVLHQGNKQEALQRQLVLEAEKLFGPENVITIGPVFSRIRPEASFPDTAAFIRDFRYVHFRFHTILLKGARLFELEQLIPLMNRKLNATWFQVNLDTLVSNLRYLRSAVPGDTKIMCMVKALAYGSGSWEVAQVLQSEGVDFLAVAYTSEGIDLRNAGIALPVMIMNPDPSGIDGLIRFDLQPEIFDIDLLDRYVQAARLAGLVQYPIHLKFDTGMARLGFREDDLDDLVAYLLRYPDIQVVSVMTHLAAADDPSSDAFSREQIRIFMLMYERLQRETGIRPLRHVLNSAGVLRMPEFAMEMVRLGIGLYGVPELPSEDGEVSALKEIGSLRSMISQIHTYPAGTSVGYGRSQFTSRESRIATVPVGYADGIFRNLGNGKAEFLVRGLRAPTFGRICMDMLMLDVTDIPGAARGDEVVLFGTQGKAFISVNELASRAGTISYEILVRISPRVRRVYIRE
jgi:alanine racemase